MWRCRSRAVVPVSGNGGSVLNYDFPESMNAYFLRNIADEILRNVFRYFDFFAIRLSRFSKINSIFVGFRMNRECVRVDSARDLGTSMTSRWQPRTEQFFPRKSKSPKIQILCARVGYAPWFILLCFDSFHISFETRICPDESSRFSWTRSSVF